MPAGMGRSLVSSLPKHKEARGEGPSIGPNTMSMTASAGRGIWPAVRDDFRFYSCLYFPKGASLPRRLVRCMHSAGFFVLAILRAERHLMEYRRRDGWTLRLLALRFLLVFAKPLEFMLTKSEVWIHTDIGPNVYLSDRGYLFLGPWSIGSGTLIHDRVLIGAKAAQSDARPTIGANVWIGPECVIYGDSHLGDGCTVLPGSVLSMNVPDHAVVGGNPALIVRRGFDNTNLRRSLAVNIDRETLTWQ